MVKLRIIKVNQTKLDISLEHDIRGRKKMGFKKLEKEDYLLVVVEDVVTSNPEKI